MIGSRLTRPLLCAGALLTFTLSGCHSAFVQATVTNHTGQVIRLFEVDYPSASFGGSDLPDGGTAHYRFKILGDGPLKLSWTDAAEHDHSATGPSVQEGQEGTLALTLGPNGITWNPHLRRQ